MEYFIIIDPDFPKDNFSDADGTKKRTLTASSYSLL